MSYFLHASLLMAASFCFYRLLLKQETFFRLNRRVLVFSLLVSAVLPLVSIPESWSFRSGESSEASPIAELITDLTSKKENIGQEELNKPINNTELTRPEADISGQENSAYEKSLPPVSGAISTEVNKASTDLQSTAQEETLAPTRQEVSTRLNFTQILIYLYYTGVVVFGLTFLVQLMLLIAKMTSLNSMKDGNFRIVELVKDEAPYSFFNAIFVNPAKYDPDTFEQIIDHEKIHIKQVHFFDKMIAELALIVFWFNPFVWLYRRAITNNLEYLTDESMLQQGTEKQRYQLSLLQVSVPQHALNLTTNYNQSFLKDRITMMNAKKSSARSFWKYLFILPLFALSMMSMNNVIFEEDNLQAQTETEEALQDYAAQDDNNDPKKKKNKKNKKNKKAKSDEFSGEAAAWEDRQNRTVYTEEAEDGEFHMSAKDGEFSMSAKDGEDEFSMIISESKFEIKAKGKKESKNKSLKLSKDKGFHLSGDWGDINTRPGTWQGEIEGDRVCLQINNSSPMRNNYWIQTACFDKSEFSNIPRGKRADFYIVRDAGRLNLSGEFGNNNFGDGDFEFIEDKEFASFLRNEGVRMRDDSHSEMFRFFIAGIDRKYVRDMKAEGFDLDGHLLSELAIHGVSADYLRGMEKAGLRGTTTRKIIEAKIHGVTPEYAQEMARSGYSDLSLRNLVEFRIHGVSTELVQELENAGFRNLSASKIKEAAVHGVRSDYIKDLKRAGYRADDIDDVIHAKIHGVSSDYVAQFEKMGFNTSDLEEIQECKIHGVSPDYIREIQNAGFPDLTLDEAKDLKIHGVSADYIRRVNRMGFGNLSLDDIQGARIHGLSANYLEDMKNLGFNNIDFDEIVGAKIHGVSPSYIENLRAEGMNESDLEEYVSAKIHGVTGSYVARAKKAGYNMRDLEDYVDLKIRKGNRL